MPSATAMRRAWSRPAKTYAKGAWAPRPLLGQRITVTPVAVAQRPVFYPGLSFNLFGPDSQRLGWGRVDADGMIELFDADSNRIGGLRPTFLAFAGKRNGARKYAPSVEALKEGEVLEIGPDGKRGVWRSIGGNPIFIEVAKGESVPKAVRRVQEGANSGREAGKGAGSAAGRSADFLKGKSLVRDPGQAVEVSDLIHKVIGTDASLGDLHKTYVVPLGLEKEDLTVRYSRNNGTVTFSATGFIDGELANIIRTFRRGPDGGLEVGHELFDLPTAAQGRGIAARVYAAQEDLYRKMGVRRASMIADGTIGKYAWALHGFDFANPGERERTASSMRAIGRNVFGIEPPKDFGRMTHAWELATASTGTPIRLDGALRSKILKDLPGKRSELSDLKDGDYGFGKLAMILDGSWNAVKDYGPDGNSEGAGIGRAYLSKKVKKAAEVTSVGGGGGKFGQDSAAFHAELGGWPDDVAGTKAVRMLLESSPKKSIESIILEHPDWDREQIKLELRRLTKEVSR